MEDVRMIKVAKTISTSAIAIATALVMAVSASAACAHGKYGTRTPRTYKALRIHSPK